MPTHGEPFFEFGEVIFILGIYISVLSESSVADTEDALNKEGEPWKALKIE
jgi:hypothetical protein